MDYTISEFARCFRRSFLVLVLSSVIPFVVAQYMDRSSFLGFTTIVFISVLNVLVVAWMFLSKEIKMKLLVLVKSKFDKF